MVTRHKQDPRKGPRQRNAAGGRAPQYLNSYLQGRINSNAFSPDVERRILTEGRIMWRAAKALTDGGFEILVMPGQEEEEGLTYTGDPREIMAASQQCDDDLWLVRDKLTQSHAGSVTWVQGNDGWDVLADWGWRIGLPHGDRLNILLEHVSDYAEKFEQGLP